VNGNGLEDVLVSRPDGEGDGIAVVGLLNAVLDRDGAVIAVGIGDAYGVVARSLGVDGEVGVPVFHGEGVAELGAVVGVVAAGDVAQRIVVGHGLDLVAGHGVDGHGDDVALVGAGDGIAPGIGEADPDGVVGVVNIAELVHAGADFNEADLDHGIAAA